MKNALFGAPVILVWEGGREGGREGGGREGGREVKREEGAK